MPHPRHPDRHGAEMSRRAFLKESGLAAAGVAMLDEVICGPSGVSARETEIPVAGPGSVSITLNVNGADRTISVEPRATLAEALRGPLALTGTKIGCDRGACSACTVWLDGVPVNSCMTLAIDVGERQVTTIEGLADGDKLHPVQASFIDHDAMQCGFCTPGLVMTCAALVERIPNPSADDVTAAIGGHLCRCGAYQNVVAATLAAASVRNR